MAFFSLFMQQWCQQKQKEQKQKATLMEKGISISRGKGNIIQCNKLFMYAKHVCVSRRPTACPPRYYGAPTTEKSTYILL